MTSIVDRFLTAFLGPDTLLRKGDMYRLANGSVHLVMPDGSQVQMGLSGLAAYTYDFTSALTGLEVVNTGIHIPAGAVIGAFDGCYVVDDVTVEIASPGVTQVGLIFGSGPDLVTDASTLGPDGIHSAAIDAPIVPGDPAGHGNPALRVLIGDEVIGSGEGVVSPLGFDLYATLRDSGDFTAPAVIASGTLRYVIQF